LLPHIDSTDRYLIFDEDKNKYNYKADVSCYDITQYFYISYFNHIKSSLVSLVERKEFSDSMYDKLATNFTYLDYVKGVATSIHESASFDSIKKKVVVNYLDRLSVLDLMEEIKEHTPVDESFIKYLLSLQKSINRSDEVDKTLQLMLDYSDQAAPLPKHKSNNISDVSKIHWLIGTRLAGSNEGDAKLDSYREVLGMKCVEDMHPGYAYLHKLGKSISSQYEQDGIIRALFELIGTHSKTYLEIGGGSIHDNSYNLLVNGWQGYAINSGHYYMDEKAKIRVEVKWVTKENVNSILNSLDIPSDFEFLSIDIDSHDLTIWEAISDAYKPKVVALEFNPNFPLGIDAILQKDLADFCWDEYSKNFGASLTSFIEVGRKKGYEYVYHLPFTDIFFIRSDLVPEILKGINPEETFDTFPLHNPSLTGIYQFSSDDHWDQHYFLVYEL